MIKMNVNPNAVKVFYSMGNEDATSTTPIIATLDDSTQGTVGKIFLKGKEYVLKVTKNQKLILN